MLRFLLVTLMLTLFVPRGFAQWHAGRVNNAAWLESYDAEGFVTLCFQAYLGRDPRPDEIAQHAASLRQGWGRPDEIRQGIASCPEARDHAASVPVPTEDAPPTVPEAPMTPPELWGPDPATPPMPERYLPIPAGTPAGGDGWVEVLEFDALLEERPSPQGQAEFQPPDEGFVDGVELLEPSNLPGGDGSPPSGDPRASRTGNASLYARNALWDEVIGNRIGSLDGGGGFNGELKALIRKDPLRRRLLEERAVVAINPADFSPAYARQIRSLPRDAKKIAQDEELSRLATATLGMVLWAKTPKGLQPVLVMDVFQNAHAAQDLGLIPGRDGERWFVGDFHIGWLERNFGLSWDGAWKRVSGNLPEQAPRVTLYAY